MTDIAIYEHFMLLHWAISILVSKKHITNLKLELPKTLLDMFVNHCKKMYGIEFLVYNVHVLCHLCDDVNIYGPLDEISAFPFENYLGKLKSLIHGQNNPLQQICNRLHEIDNLFSSIRSSLPQNRIIHEMQHFTGKLPYSGYVGKQYKKIHYKGLVFSIRSHSFSNCHAMIANNLVIEIINITLNYKSETIIIGKMFQSCSHFYKYPLNSNILNTYIVSDLSDNIKQWPITIITCKCLLLLPE